MSTFSIIFKTNKNNVWAHKNFTNATLHTMLYKKNNPISNYKRQQHEILKAEITFYFHCFPATLFKSHERLLCLSPMKAKRQSNKKNKTTSSLTILHIYHTNEINSQFYSASPAHYSLQNIIDLSWWIYHQ